MYLLRYLEQRLCYRVCQFQAIAYSGPKVITFSFSFFKQFVIKFSGIIDEYLLNNEAQKASFSKIFAWINFSKMVVRTDVNQVSKKTREKFLKLPIEIKLSDMIEQNLL